MARNGHLEILSGRQRFRERAIQFEKHPTPADRCGSRPISGRLHRSIAVVSFFNPFLSREREEGNTIDYNKSGYFETSPLSRIHLLVTHRFFRGAGGELPPFGSETKKGRGRRKNGYEYKRRTQLRLHQTSFSSRTTRSVWKERKENVYIWRERKRGRESLCLSFHAPAFSTAR